MVDNEHKCVGVMLLVVVAMPNQEATVDVMHEVETRIAVKHA